MDRIAFGGAFHPARRRRAIQHLIAAGIGVAIAVAGAILTLILR